MQKARGTMPNGDCSHLGGYYLPKFTRRLALVAFWILLLCRLGPAAWVQLSGATIAGAVKDSTGALVPGAQVTVRNTETGVSRTLQTNSTGRYQASNLSPGEYEVQAEMTGFQSEVRRGISLTIGREAVVDFSLQVGQVAEQVVVTGEAPLVDTSSAALTGLVDQQQVSDLPLNGRSVTQLTTLQPGVLLYQNQNADATTGNGQTISVNGARPRQINFLLNGTHMMNMFGKSPGGVSGGQMGVEAVREFTVLSNSYSAEFGRSSGGVINAVTKSGTNTFHGSVFEYLRNDNLDAPQWEDNAFSGGRKPEFKRNQFGASLGGPIRRDKTFFFVNGEWLRDRQGSTNTATLPTASARQGNLPNRPSFTVSSTIRPWLDLLPLPAGQDLGDGTARHSVVSTTPTDQNYGNVRLDHQFSEADSLFGSYVIDDSIRSTFNPITQGGSDLPFRSQYVALEENHILTPALLNTAHAGLNRSTTQSVITCSEAVKRMAFVPYEGCSFFQGTGISTPGGSLGPRIFLFTSFQYWDTLSWARGNHVWKFGGYYERMRINGLQYSAFAGRYNFSGLENFLRGTAQFFEAPLPGLNVWRGMRQNLFAFFANDSFRLRPNVTVNMGMRYEFITPPTEVDGLLGNIPCLTCPTKVGEPLFENPSLKNFSPRVGVAWSPGDRQDTSVRAGFGIFFDPMIHHQWLDAPFHAPPFWGEGRVTSPPFPNAYDLLQAGSGAVAPSFLFAVDGKPAQPYNLQYNFSVQRQLPGQMVVLAAYVGSVGRHLARVVDNSAIPTIQPDGSFFFPSTSVRRNSNFAEVRFRTWDTNSSYNSFQLGVRRRHAQGIGYQISYTWSKALDQMSESQGTGDLFNDVTFTLLEFLSIDKGRSAYDARHNFSSNFTVDIPLGNRMTGIAAKLVAGWQGQGILTLRSGLPTSVTMSFDRARSRSTREFLRPNLNPGFTAEKVVLGPPNQTQDPNSRYLDPAAFSLPAEGTVGNWGRGVFSGPGLATVDFSLMKNTGITERVNTEFRAEFFNLFNHPNFGYPSTTAFTAPTQTVPVGNFAAITATRTTGRQIQFALKVTF